MRRAARLLPAVLLAACGQSGDLYLRSDPPPAAPATAEPPAAEAPAPAAEPRDTDEKEQGAS